MTERLILAIDQGTTGTSTLILNSKLEILAKSNVEFEQIFPKPGWVEHRAEDIWQSVVKSTETTINEAKISPKQIAGIGITNQRETTCLFDLKGKAAHNFIVWQCRRTTDICQQLKEQKLEDKIKHKTGLVLDPYFSATKLMWLFEHNKNLRTAAQSGDLLFGTIDSWLLYQLSGQQTHKTDATNASRTLLMDLASCQWDQELMSIFDIPQACLPEISPNGQIFGTTKGLSFLPDGIPIAALVGDQQGALFGQSCFNNGEAKATYGTGSFILLNTAENLVRSRKGLLTSVAMQLNEEVHYCLEGAAFIAGAAVQWLRDKLGFIANAADIEALAAKEASSGEVCFIPALAGLSAPYWQPDARGLLCGLSRDSNRSHISRAVLEGIALQNRDIMEIMKTEGGNLTELKVDGGAAANNLLMQYQADVLQIPCHRAANLETTALGAAALAGLTIGLFKDKQALKQLTKTEHVFSPTMAKSELETHLHKWHKAIERVQLN